jgi:hypothetical protein
VFDTVAKIGRVVTLAVVVGRGTVDKLKATEVVVGTESA